MAPSPEQLPLVEQAIEQYWAPLGINVVVFEIDYNFAWKSHPEIQRGNPITFDQAREFAAICHKHGVRVVPLMNCLGHQSWSKQTGPLLVKHPEFDETPQLAPDNPGIYCRSWCPQAPGLDRFVFDLMDELFDAFQADGFHVGMDEVFIIGHEQCSRCAGKDPSELFALAVNHCHEHLIGKLKTSMFIWGDRLLDDQTMKYGEWESSKNNTWHAIDKIPKDIIVCDWHYEPRAEYPSVPFFQKKGFRVLPSGWRNLQAALALRAYSRANAGENMLGYMCTTWASSTGLARVVAGENSPSLKEATQLVRVIEACNE